MAELALSRFVPDFDYTGWLDGPTLPPEFRALAALSDGGFLSVWSTDRGIYARLHDADGQAEAGGIVLTTGNWVSTWGVDNTPRVDAAVLADGTAVALWMTADQLWAQHFDTDGTLLGDPVLLGEDLPDRTGDALADLGIVALADGGYAVTWTVGSFETRLGCYDPDGTARSGMPLDLRAFDLSAVLPANQLSGARVPEVQDLLALSDGSVLALMQVSGVTQLTDTTTNFSDLVLQRFDTDGAAIGDPVRLTDDRPTETHGQIAELANGTIVVAWEDDSSVVVQLFSAAGVALGAAEVVAERNGQLSYLPTAIVALPDGGFVLSYTELTSDSRVLMAQLFDAAGQALGDPLSLGTTEVGTEDLPLIALDSAHIVFGGLTGETGFAVLQVNTLAEGVPVLGEALVLREDAPMDPEAVELSGITDANGLAAIEDFTVTWVFVDADGNETNRQAAVDDTGAYFTPGDYLVGQRVLAEVSFRDSEGNLETLRSALSEPIAAVNDAPDVSNFRPIGSATDNQLLSVQLTGISGIYDADGLGDAAARSYQWLRDGVAIAGATEADYLLGQADVGHQMSVRVTYLDGQGFTEVVTTATTATVANADDPLTGSATFTGSVTQHETVQIDTSGLADEDGIASFTYSWYVGGGTLLQSGTSDSFTLDDQSLVGRNVYVIIRTVDEFGGTGSYRLDLGVVANVNDPATGAPVITGLAQEDAVLRGDISSLGDADGRGTVSFQWLRDGAEITGATAIAYQLVQADVGHRITLRASFTDGYGAFESVTSAATASVANVNDPVLGEVLITGTLREDSVLAADPSALSDEDGLGAFTYQWLRDGVAIAGATGQRYQLVQDDVGAMMAVRVSYVDGQGTVETVLAAADPYDTVENVDDPVTGSPVILGAALENTLLRADISSIHDEDGTAGISYQWFADGIAIAGATLSELRLREAQIGTRVTVEITHTDAFGSSERIESGATEVVEALPRLLVGTEENDRLAGNSGDDTLRGAEGNDQLFGLTGNDSIDGGDGADTLIGGDGNDTLIGGTGTEDLRDLIYGGAGDDSIIGGYGNDELRGDAGNDTIEGGFGADTLIGGAGNDTLAGSAFSDQIIGGDGDDWINGGFGFDRVNGGTGADRFYHLGVAGHGTDWIQDYSAADGDELMFGNVAAQASDFQINWATTAGAGEAGVQEAFIVYRPTGQLIWALVDGAAQDQIWLRIGSETWDLLA